MADNAYTAFDPTFWSYHSNIDRMMEVLIRDNPAAQFTSGFTIQPFQGSTTNIFAPTDQRRWLYTSIGDMARDSRAIGYDYGPPVTPDWQGEDASDTSSGRQPLSVVFSRVRCTQESYTIDAFLNQTSPVEKDVDPRNPHYVGRFSRIGMGIEDDKGRCILHGVTRVLDATRNAAALGLTPNSECELTLLVRNIATGESLAPAQYLLLPGFQGQLMWSMPGAPVHSTLPPPPPGHAQGGSCYHATS